jgi:hypothetical protein
MTHCFLYSAVAPSRFTPRSVDDGQVNRAKVFAADAFPGLFPENPVWADDRFTEFAIEDRDGGREHQLYVHRTGLIELMWPLALETLDDDPPSVLVDAGEIARVVAGLARAVGGDTYAQLSRAGRGRRRFARVDWWFQLAVSVPGDNGPRHWTGLKFAVAEPPRAAHRWPASPPEGYAGTELRSVRRRKPAAEIARTMLTAVVTANGYYDFASAVEKTVGREVAGTDQPRSSNRRAPHA